MRAARMILGKSLVGTSSFLSSTSSELRSSNLRMLELSSAMRLWFLLRSWRDRKLIHAFKVDRVTQRTLLPLLLSTYWTTAVLGPISSPARNLSFGASQAALGLLDEEQLFIQGILLKLQLLQKSRRRLQFLLQRKDGAVFGFDFVHLRGRQ